MATTPSMQVCLETSDWLKAIVADDVGSIDHNSTSSPLTDQLISCVRSQPLLERRLRPPHDQALKCPRCDSTHTKFCYYNNYSLSQPRYFCKTCRRYWTKGGSIRNVPVGGGCRKNKRSTTVKKPVDQPPFVTSHHNQYRFHSTDHLQLSNINFMFDNQNNLFTGNYDIGLAEHFPGINSSTLGLGFSMGALRCDRGAQEEVTNIDAVEVKPGDRMLSLEWPDDGCSDSYNGYVNGLGIWAGMINGHGPSSSSAAM